MKSAPIFRFDDEMKVDVHKLIHLTGKLFGEHVFERLQIVPQNDFLPFLVSG